MSNLSIRTHTIDAILGLKFSNIKRREISTELEMDQDGEPVHCTSGGKTIRVDY